MSRVVATVAITAFILAIAAAVALTLRRFVPIDANGTIAVAIGVLVLLQMIHSGYQRVRDQGALRRRMEDLARLEDGLSKPMQQLAARVAALEQTVGNRPTAELDRLLNEVEVLGTLVKHLAESVADLDQRVTEIAGARPAAPAMTISANDAARAQAEAIERVRLAIEAGSIEIHLQPIVTLPQRRARFYEALTRLRTADDSLIMPQEYLPIAERAGLMPKIDNLVLFRSVQLLRSLTARQKETGLFLNLSADSLADSEFFAEFSGFMQANKALSDSLIFEMSQAAVDAFGPIEHESVGAIAAMGFRLSMDRVTNLNADFKKLAERGFRFVKIAAPTLLRRSSRSAPHIAPADMSDMLARYGIDLIADRIETEAEVIDLLDYDIRLGQGNLFAPPRPVRSETIAKGPSQPPLPTNTSAAPAAAAAG